VALPAYIERGNLVSGDNTYKALSSRGDFNFVFVLSLTSTVATSSACFSSFPLSLQAIAKPTSVVPRIGRKRRRPQAAHLGARRGAGGGGGAVAARGRVCVGDDHAHASVGSAAEVHERDV